MEIQTVFSKGKKYRHHTDGSQEKPHTIEGEGLHKTCTASLCHKGKAPDYRRQ